MQTLLCFQRLYARPLHHCTWDPWITLVTRTILWKTISYSSGIFFCYPILPQGYFCYTRLLQQVMGQRGQWYTVLVYNAKDLGFEPRECDRIFPWLLSSLHTAPIHNIIQSWLTRLWALTLILLTLSLKYQLTHHTFAAGILYSFTIVLQHF